jgi:hypothetical protein
MRQSGLQKEVSALYRKVLREAVKKDRSVSSPSSTPSSSNVGAGARHSFVALIGNHRDSDAAAVERLDSSRSTTTTTSFAAAEFRRQAASVQRSDFKKVEYMIRKGHKQVKLLQMAGVKVVHGTSA